MPNDIVTVAVDDVKAGKYRDAAKELREFVTEIQVIILSDINEDIENSQSMRDFIKPEFLPQFQYSNLSEATNL